MTTKTRRLRAVLGAARLVRDPNRLDEVFAIADGLVSESVLLDMRDAFARSDTGKHALAQRPRLGPIDLTALRALPAGSLGRTYAEHMARNGLDPSAIPTRRADDELSFIRAHLYETHDIWHAVTGFAADVPGELALQAFSLAQYPARLGAIILGGSFFNTLLFNWGERDARMRGIARGWLLGKRAAPLFGIRWGEQWRRPLAEVRRELGLDLDSLDALDTQTSRAA